MKNPGGGRELLVSNSVTTLDESAAGRVVIAGSHCGIYAAYLAARAGARAVILNDAGVGKESAGIGGLAWLAALGIPAAALGHRTARIGDGPDDPTRDDQSCECNCRSTGLPTVRPDSPPTTPAYRAAFQRITKAGENRCHSRIC